MSQYSQEYTLGIVTSILSSAESCRCQEPLGLVNQTANKLKNVQKVAKEKDFGTRE